MSFSELTLREKLTQEYPDDVFLDYEGVLALIDKRDWSTKMNLNILVTDREVKNLTDFLGFYSFDYSISSAERFAKGRPVFLVLVSVRVPDLNLFEGLGPKDHCYLRVSKTKIS